MDEEEYVSPAINDYTIYSKSGCPNCVKIKKYLCEVGAKLLVINCDEYIVENKEIFLRFMEGIAGKEVKTFPMVFYEGQYIGGYSETEKHYNMTSAFSNKTLF
jgi:glutaredoxin